MLDNSKISIAATNSFGTSAHETGTSVITLTGNPYVDLAAYGIDLQGCTVSYLRKPNRKRLEPPPTRLLSSSLLRSTVSTGNTLSYAAGANGNATLPHGCHAIPRQIFRKRKRCSYLATLCSRLRPAAHPFYTPIQKEYFCNDVTM